jgi:tetratricopeptide (TPR) repeat protein
LNTSQTARKTETIQAIGVCVFLVLAVLAVFGQTARFEFFNYDDPLNVYQNPVVIKGLSVQAIGWAFSHPQTGNWIPLTTLSHMLDCQIFGLHAGGHHLVNVLWHAANAVLLFLVLRQLTGSLWRSAFVAALFAVHPLRAESVAWVSERKDVLSGFFFILTMWGYVRHVRKPSCARYFAVLLLFALGLMAKGMVATLPFVLLLLDYWPLGRLHNPRELLALVREKIPLLAIAAADCVVTALMPGLMVHYRLPLLERVGNALVSYVVYLRQMIFPVGLAAHYPIAPHGQPVWLVCLAFVLLAAIFAVLVACRQRYPYLLMGWLWYLGMSFPVIGIIQISSDAAHADRYTYLPEIGLAIAVAWRTADWLAKWVHGRMVFACLTVAMICALTVWGHIQTSYWRNDESLWTRSLACAADFNSLAHNGLGNALYESGKKKEAIAQYRQALDINPAYKVAHFYLGRVLFDQGQREEALAHYRMALESDPDYADARCNLANALSAMGGRMEAIAQYRKVLESNPDYPEARYNLANTLLQSGKLEEAIAQYQRAVETAPKDARIRNNLGIALAIKGDNDGAMAQFRKALEINPAFVDAHYDLGAALAKAGKLNEAIVQYRKTLEINPNQLNALNNLAWLLAAAPDASLRNGANAVALAEQASQLTRGGEPSVLRTLAAAYAETGRFADAAATARRALELAVAQRDDDLMASLPGEIKLYEANTPMRDGP